MKKNDKILIISLLIIAIFLYGVFFLYQGISTQNAVAVIAIAGEDYKRLPLDENIVETIKLENGGYNIMEIKDGFVYVIEASCPDKICVNHRPINKNGQTIVCMPNKLVVEIKSVEEADVDSYTN